MSSFLQWLTSANGTSIIVAVLTLIGAFGTTLITNRKADQRRIADQIAEDKRRRSERAAQLVLEETARERREVSQCVREINEAAEEAIGIVKKSVSALLSNSGSGDSNVLLEAKVLQAQARAEFYLRAISATDRLRLELNQPVVRSRAEELSRFLHDESNRFRFRYGSDFEALLGAVSDEPIISGDLKKSITALIDSAFEHLHMSLPNGENKRESNRGNGG
ncbi:hypothetical protein [uncultured Corynebacterium sp.]|uniref:hypothetical protein n=1 Tax=uncultured Corynebacterium sp. TaxID=159447 RepID=UPI00259BB593|nr:hypothetical protein [uncultured Corynebacterium sp.]